jgi:hypothetical protein
MLEMAIEKLFNALTLDEGKCISEAVMYLAAFREGNHSLIVKDDINEIISNLMSNDRDIGDAIDRLSVMNNYITFL